jgi:hypothetical protein
VDLRDVDPAIRRTKMRLDPTAARGAQMATLPPEVRWKADNYNHLHEQPMLFYAITIVQYLVDPSDHASLALAWIYVGLRVVHSLWQALRNVIEVRFVVFLVSSLVLLASTIRLGASML